MTLVVDKNNYTGMFSGIGRYCSEVFPILQINLLEDKKQIIKKKFDPTKQQVKIKEKIKKEITPFQKQLDREVFYKVHRDPEDKNNQRFGIYKPQYSLVFPKNCLLKNKEDNLQNKSKQQAKYTKKLKKKNQESQSINKSQKTLDLSLNLKQKNQKEYQSLYLCDSYFKKKTQGSFPFNHRIKRDNIFIINAHEKRFDNLNLPQNKIPSVNIEQEAYRDLHSGVLQTNLTNLQYDVNYKQVEKIVDPFVTNLQKQIPRKYQYLPNYTLHDEFHFNESEINNNKSQVLKKVSSPIFQKMKIRDFSPHLHLPMKKVIKDWGINLDNEKSKKPYLK